MSSGNPFGASLALHQAPPSPLPPTPSGTSTPEARHPHGDVLPHAVSPPPPRTRKHVRIESPTVSIPQYPDHASASASEHPAQATSPAPYADPPSLASPVRSSNANVNADGLYTREAGRSREPAAARGGQDRQGNLADAGRAPAVMFLGAAPTNPFSKTLASIEPAERGGSDNRAATERATQGASRASLDVESFKNLLMTGRPSPRQPGQPSQTHTHSASGLNTPLFESSSSIDTSSILHQSLFEAAHEPPSESSPRTSYEMPASEDDDRAPPVLEPRKEKKKPPPAPKPRHGKPVSRQPQTVSFDSFTATDTTSPKSRPRESSDVYKPLPPTPMSPTSSRNNPLDAALDSAVSTPQRTNEPPSVSESIQPQKRVPPPAPLARRQSQFRNSMIGNRSRSGSSLTISSQHTLDEIASHPNQNTTDPSLGLKSPPPPPPPRHGTRLVNMSSSSANSSTTELPQRSTPVRSAVPQEPSISRKTTMDMETLPTASDAERALSTSSKRNSLRTISGEITSSMPPPPPPPRRRQSNRSSLEIQRSQNPSRSPTESRRTSTEYRRLSTENHPPSVDSKRRTSMNSESSLRHAYTPADEPSADEQTGTEFPLYSPNKEAGNVRNMRAEVGQRADSSNILDDMEKFQREIDELRNRYKQSG